jgi:hypothetical protein
MHKMCCLAVFCLMVSSFTHAQTAAPKVIFVGDDILAGWQATSGFTANKNWVGKGVMYGNLPGTWSVLDNFQTNVVNQHPAIVFIMTGFSDATTPKDSTPNFVVQAFWQSKVSQMVAMAKKANIKVILGNMIYLMNNGEVLETVNIMNAWLDQFGRANGIPVVNYNAAFCTFSCGAFTLETAFYLPAYETTSAFDATVTPAGYALMTQMAQTAIATYGLTIKGGYLSNVSLYDIGTNGGNRIGLTIPQVNTVTAGYALVFTANATWSDGVTRSMQNANFDDMQGIWTSSNPNVMYISQQGQAIAIGPGTTSISFVTASGIHFSPWTMYVGAVDLSQCC